MTDAEQIIRERLFALQDHGYRIFHSRLMPTVNPELVIGVRMPALRKLAAELAGRPEAEAFLRILPHHYYEENNLHGLLIERIRPFEACVEALEAFLPFIDNWATCDLLSPKQFRTHLPELLEHIRRWLVSGQPYTVRFGIEMLMTWYLGEAFRPDYPELVAAIRSEEYYVNMMIAWFFATALAKQYDAVLPYLEQRRLSPWTHHKTIRKAIESDRITPEQKLYLRSLTVNRND